MWRFIGLLLALAAFMPACDPSQEDSPVAIDDDDTLDGGVCESGETRECTCPIGLPGIQYCFFDGSGWGLCGCLDEDPPPPDPCDRVFCEGEQICKNGNCVDPIYPQILPGAQLQPNQLSEKGERVLINGRALTPASEGVEVGTFPTNMLFSPDRSMMIVNENGAGTYREQLLRVVDPQTLNVVDVEDPPAADLFNGLQFNADGSRLYVSAGSDDRILVYRVLPEKQIEFMRWVSLPEGCYPSGLEMDLETGRLYIGCLGTRQIIVMDTASNELLHVWDVQARVLEMVLLRERNLMLVGSWYEEQPELGGEGKLQVISTEDGSIVKTIVVGKHPEGIVVDAEQNRAWVIASTSERLDELNLQTLEVVRQIPFDQDGNHLAGILPVYGVLSPDETRMYVACSGINALAVVDVAQAEVIGYIPTDWYPTDVEISTDGKTLYILNGKGDGSGASSEYEWNVLQPGALVWTGLQIIGTLNKVPIPDVETLEQYSEQVQSNTQRSLRLFDLSKGNDTAIPSTLGDPSPIEYVFFIMKENNCYDAFFGDLEIGNGAPELTLWTEDNAPNHRKLARNHVLMDNFSCDGETSLDGKYWASAAYMTDFYTKAWQVSFYHALFPEFDFAGLHPGSIGQSKSILPHLLEYGISVRSYGVSTWNFGYESEQYRDYISHSFPGYNLGLSDTVKAKVVIDEFKQFIRRDQVPQFTFILLPNDHTYGTREGYETPESMVADNDEALGMLVEYISNSPIWEKSVIFIWEDDPMGGLDHVDAHRLPGIIVGPYAKRGYVSSVTYSLPNMLKTVEMIFGVPPMSRWDANASPMYDCFRAKPDLTPYVMEERRWPVEFFSPKIKGELVEATKKMDFEDLDQNPGLGQLVWKYMKGSGGATKPGREVPRTFTTIKLKTRPDRIRLPDASHFDLDPPPAR